jgi:hypothetical protein
MDNLSESHQKIKMRFERETGLSDVEYEVKDRLTGAVLVIQLSNPTERLFGLLQKTLSDLEIPEEDGAVATLAKKSKKDLLHAAEGRLLLRTLTESLNVNRHSFGQDFFTRYIESVSGVEQQITANSNHIVLGRRGAGKTSLLLYALHGREKLQQPSIWVDMQVYSQRSDVAVAADVIFEIIHQAKTIPHFSYDTSVSEKLKYLSAKEQVTEQEIRLILPEVRRCFSSLTNNNSGLFIFLDDYHVLSQELQPLLLSLIYSFTRGNNIYIKISAIDTLLQAWNSTSRQGLQVPHDAQELKLDYNLTIPDRATEHIRNILDAHAAYCALASIRLLCRSNDVLSRLVWVTAGVPRDALNLFSQAMSKASLDGRQRVTVTDVNSVASEALANKQQELESDVSVDVEHLRNLMSQIQEFCIRDQRKNAFIVEIATTQPFQRIQQLVDLRLLHIINEGITIREAGRKYLALILDYSFYIGIRAAKSVDLFNKQTKKVAYKELRSLPVLRI